MFRAGEASCGAGQRPVMGTRMSCAENNRQVAFERDTWGGSFLEQSLHSMGQTTPYHTPASQGL